MKITYDPDVDILRILFSDVLVEESDEDKAGAILDYDAAGNIVGIEFMDASTRINNPLAVEYAVMRARPA
jgi:YD repeat-containing protein